MKIRQVPFKESQYIKEEHPKKQIYLHHTAGNANGDNVYKHWEGTPVRVATCVTISGIGRGCTDGEIVQGFSSKYWAFHLGLQEATFQKFGVKYKSLDRISIGIEICNWGYLTLKDGKYYNYVGGVVPESQVIKLAKKYKGKQYFHNYTDAQIESVRQLLLLWKERYGIPLKYNEDIWDICPRALNGDKGVFTHNSVRMDKIDIYPHPKMIDMLKSL
jgi:hypothetical protein